MDEKIAGLDGYGEMKPFYDDGRVKLHQADVLAWARIDAGEALPFCLLTKSEIHSSIFLPQDQL